MKPLQFLLTLGLLACIPQVTSAEVHTGKLHEESTVSWSFDTETHTLTLSGTGSTGDESYDLEIAGGRLHALTKKIVIGEGITRIGGWNFSQFWDVTSVTLPTTLREIGNSAFRECNSLREIVIPDNVEVVEADAYCDCDGATRLYIGKGLREFYSIWATAFAACDALQTVEVSPENPYFESRGCNGIFSNDTLHFGCRGTVIPEGIHVVNMNAFIRNESITEVTFPSTLRVIGHHAFHENKNLTTVHFNDSIESIDWCAFGYCDRLTCDTLRLPAMCRDLGEGAFWYCPNIKAVILGDSLRTIGIAPFANDPITYVRMGRNVESIAGSAFAYLPIKHIYIPPTVKQIEGAAFACESLERVDIDDIDAWCHIRMYGAMANPATYGRIYLKGQPITEITIPEDVVALWPGIFSGFTDLEKVHMHYGLSTIGSEVFNGCTALKELRFPPTVRNLGYTNIDGGYTWIESFLYKSAVERVYLYNRTPSDEAFQIDRIDDKPIYPDVYVPTGTQSAYEDKMLQDEERRENLRLHEFDVTEASDIAPILPRAFYLVDQNRNGKVVPMEQTAPGVFKATHLFTQPVSSIPFTPQAVIDWYNFGPYSYFVDSEEQNSHGGSYNLTMDDRWYGLEAGQYEFEVNLRTMTISITSAGLDVAEYKRTTTLGFDLSPFASLWWEGQTGTYWRDGRSEHYDAWMSPEGVVLQQTIDGLVPGTKYEAVFEAAASFTPGRGFEAATGVGGTVLFVSEGMSEIEVIEREDVFEYPTYSVVGTVNEAGQLTFGMKNLVPSGNWFVIELKSLKVTDKPVTTLGIEQVRIDTPANGKRIIDGKLRIFHNGKVYNSIGQQL